MSGFGLNARNRGTVRAPINPMDKSTVFSIYPKRVPVKFHTLSPSVFELEPGSLEKPSALVVGPASWWREVDENQPLIEIVTGSTQIATSIVNDFCNGLLGSNMGDSMPGLFWLPGEITVAEAQKNHKSEFVKADARQKNYFRTLVTQADAGWAKTNGSPLSITDDMRMAANYLQVAADKPWMKDAATFKRVNCKHCGTLVDPAYPMCFNCKLPIDGSKV